MIRKNVSKRKLAVNAGNVLIVDDNPANLRLLSELLSKRGYKVRPANSGTLALTSIQSILPDVILLDIKMPKMDGYEVCKRLKADKETCHVPVLFISALSDVADKVKGFGIGAVDYITKPFQQEEVLARVNTHVTLFRMKQSLEKKVVERTLELFQTIERLDAEIVERKHAETEKNRLLEAVRQSGESIVITDKNGIILFVNPAFETMTGYSYRDSIGQNPRFLKSGFHEHSFYKDMWRQLLKGNTWQGDLVNKKKDGGFFTEKTTISPVVDEHGDIVNFIAVKSDVTEQRALEEQLRHAQKMETVGRLASGVAHDFNNMLCVILGTTQLIMCKENIEEEILQDLLTIQRAAKRSSDITQQLLDFSRKQMLNPRVVQLNQLVGDVVKMLTRLLGEDIDILFSPDTEIANIKVDTGQFNQILSNLCINARDAMPTGGKLIIKSENVTVSANSYGEEVDCVPGDYLMLSVSDNGSGISKDDFPHIFEPFFTTKEEGKGTGLGLASVYGAMQSNNGFIRVDSVLGHGTKFRLYFPKSNEKMKVVTDDGREAMAMDPVNILLVEDNDMVLNLTKNMLEVLGHSVYIAESPEKAIAMCGDSGVSFKLLLSDVLMPQMSGKKLRELIVTLQPDIKTLFMSGCVGNVIARHDMLGNGLVFLQKPFSLEELAAKVREVVS